MHGGRSSRIGDEDADLGLVDDRLHLRWRETTFDLTRAVVRHRDDGGRIQFSVTAPDGTPEVADYARCGPSEEQLAFDLIDFTADEPWTWEDSDFGLFVFHVATGTGPIKFRHTLEPSDAERRPQSAWPPQLRDGRLERPRIHARSESVSLDRLVEVRAKFEVSGIWSPRTVLTFDDGDDLLIVPIASDRDARWVTESLMPVVARLPDWGARKRRRAHARGRLRPPAGDRPGRRRDAARLGRVTNLAPLTRHDGAPGTRKARLAAGLPLRST